MSASSGTIAQVTESAVRAASAANRSTDRAPCIGPRRPQTMPPATTAPPTSTIRTSTTVVPSSWVPPAAPKATPASAPPSSAAASHSRRTRPSQARLAGGLGSASEESGERNTRRRDLGQERDARHRRDALAHGHESTDQGDEGDRDQGNEQRDGKVVAGAGQVEEAVRARLNLFVADLYARGALLRVGGDGGQILVVMGASRLLLGRERSAIGSQGGAAAALVRAAGDGAGQDLAAVAVLVQIRGEVLDRLAELLVLVVLVEIAVRVAVEDRIRHRGAGQRDEREYGEDKESCGGSN